MLRLLLALLAGAATVFGGAWVVDDTGPAGLGVVLVAMFVVAALLPQVSFRGEPLRKPSQPPRS